MKTIINLNEIIFVELSIYGIKVYEEYCEKNNIKIKEPYRDGKWKFIMWEFFGIFSEHMFMGAKKVIEKNEILIES